MKEQAKIADKTPYTEKITKGSYRWCSCGLSSNQPFCDGKHKATAFKPVIFEVARDKMVSLCRCKRTGFPPDCDGSHRKIKDTEE